MNFSPLRRGGWRADKRTELQINASHWQQVRIMMSRMLLGLLVSLACYSFISVADGAPL